MTLNVGITGGIGSGKSTVCKIFKLLGIPVFEADMVGRQLLNTDEKLRSKIFDLFGNEIGTPGGTINRKKLADIIFNDAKKLAWLNELVHPAVKKEFLIWAKKKEHLPYIVHETAILFESGFDKLMDYVILVTAPERQRIERVMKRDGVNEAMIMARIKKQNPEYYNKKLASIIICNDNKQLIIPKIIKIDKNLKKYGKIW